MLIQDRTRARLTVLTVAVLAFPLAAAVRADHPPPTVALARRPSPPRDPSAAHAPAAHESGPGWWVGTASVALALALCGWGSFAARRYLPKAGGASVGLRVVGRTSLSAKQTVYLLQVGERVLIVGAGGQGSPSLLGELSDREVVAHLGPRAGVSGSGRLDHRLGDDT